MKSGWEMANRVHFDEIPAEYDKARWGYPDELYADIFAYMGKDANKNAIEIGAGTGKATEPFLDAGFHVTAVELGANMAEFLKNKFAGNEKLDIKVSTFEDAVIEKSGFDLIYAASAFHWVDAGIGCPKAFDLLGSGGVFALFRNNVAAGYGLNKEVDGLYEKYYSTYYTKSKSTSVSTREELSSPEGIYRGFRFYDMADYGFSDIQMKFYECTVSYTADDYIALLKTFSDHITLPDENRKALHDGIYENIVKNGGSCKQDYSFQLYMGRKL